jgi:hypothetical protein
MTLLTILTLWAIGCIGLAILNARFWTISPDTEQEQYEQNKSRNIKPINPIIKDSYHAVRLFLFIGIVCGIVYGICSLIKSL